MAIYDGVVTLAEEEIPVIVELDDEHIRLSSSGTEIGAWRTDECQIIALEDATYSITAEDETLRFVPNQPGLFAAAVTGERVTGEIVTAETETPTGAPTTEPEPENSPTDGIREAPPAQPLTMGLFYGLCFVTTALAVWALVSMIF